MARGLLSLASLERRLDLRQYGDTFQAFATKWQAGQGSDLTKGLQGVDTQITNELKQASAGSAP